MTKYLNRKLIFLGIIILAFILPVFAQAQESNVTKSCFDYIVNGEQSKTKCRDNKEACLKEKEEVSKLRGIESVTSCNQVSLTPAQVAKIAQAEAAEAQAEAAEAGRCSLWNIDINVCMKEATSFVISIILWLMAWILWATGQLFNLSIKVSIVEFSRYAAMPAIQLIWSMGRDLANVFFIFILMYIAIATIIQKNGIDTKKMVVKLIITALLINFSIIIPKVIIDVGNSLAIVFYNNMGTPATFGAPDIAKTLIDSAKPTQFYTGLPVAGEDPGSPDTPIATLTTWSDIIIKGIGTALLILILSYVLLVATYLFLARTIILLILIATSSLVFFTRVIPDELGLNQWNKWFQALIKETFFAPAFLFMFYLVLKVAQEGLPKEITTPSTTNAAAGAAGLATAAGTGIPGWGDQIFLYILLVGLSFGSIVVARKMGTFSGKLGGNLGKKMTDGAVHWGASWGARNTVGRGAKALAGSSMMKKAAIAMPTFGGGARIGLSKVADAKFGGKQGYNASLKSRADNLKARMEGMTPEQKASYMKNLSSGGLSKVFGMNNRDILYQHGLNEEERTKIEGASGATEATVAGDAAYKAHLSAHPGEIKEAELARKVAKDTSLAKSSAFLVSQRSGLGGEDKTKTYVQRIKNEKDTSKKIALLEELKNPVELKSVIGGLDEQSLAKIRTGSGFSSASTEVQKSIEDRIGSSAEIGEKVAKEEKDEKKKLDRKNKKDSLSDFKYALGLPMPAEYIPPANIPNPVVLAGTFDKQHIEFFDDATAKAVANKDYLLRAIGEKTGLPGIVTLVKHQGLDYNEAKGVADKFKTFSGNSNLDHISKMMNDDTWHGNLLLNRDRP